MDNEKLFEFMEKMYNEMQQGFKSVNNRVDGLENKIDGIENRIDGLENKIDGLENEVKKNSIILEALEAKVDIIAEVQLNHMKQNENNHVEIVEMLSGEIELTQKAVSKIAAVK